MKKIVALTLSFETLLGQMLCIDNSEIQIGNLTLYSPCIILQYVRETARCTKFLWLDFIFY